MNSIRILLQSAIDYAGLFPPAALKMAEAAREFAADRKETLAWTLGRFVVPAARLDEFEAEAGSFLPRDPAELPWRITALGGLDRAKDLGRINSFNEAHAAGSASGTAIIDAIESKVRSVQEIRQAAGISTVRLESYFEVPLSEDTPALIATIARIGARAKVRTGGLTPEQFPSPHELARFIHLCAQAEVAFKATAGLHHPFRAVRRLTYSPVSPSGLMHGFVNLLTAAAFAREGRDAGMLEKVLEDESSGAFTFDDDGVAWRGERLATGRLLDARSHSIISFGSCSVREPWNDLKAINLL